MSACFGFCFFRLRPLKEQKAGSAEKEKSGNVKGRRNAKMAGDHSAQNRADHIAQKSETDIVAKDFPLYGARSLNADESRNAWYHSAQGDAEQEAEDDKHVIWRCQALRDKEDRGREQEDDQNFSITEPVA